jgi:hypothetical protein
MKKSVKKKFVLNIIIQYHNNMNPKGFREAIHGILKNYAYLYGFDFAAELNTDNDQEELDYKTDIIYLHSSEQTRYSLREFQKIIKTIFPPFSLYFEFGIDIYYLNQSNTKKYHFPA